MNTTGNYTTNQGDLTIEQTGENVNGKYSKTGVLSGSISGNVIAGIWKNLGKEGLFEFVFEDDLSFKGKYKIGTEPGTMRSKWDGQITNFNNTEVSKDKTTEEKNEPKTVSEKKNGIAKWVDEEENVFDGTWENDILIKGIITYHDGSLEEGEFNEEGLNGDGKCSYKDDEGALIIEKGIFKDGILIKGVTTWEDETIEEGEFNEEGLNGDGKRSYNDHNDELVVERGVFKNGDLIKGTKTLRDGTKLEGEFNKEGLNGEGEKSYNDHEEELVVEKGIFKNGYLIKGIKTLGDGTKLEGEFNEKGLNGEGSRKYRNWDGVTVIEQGTWKDGLLIKNDINPVPQESKEEPFRKIKFDNGDIYIGEIDLSTQNRHGYGAYIWKSGDYYEGSFVQGKRTGKGIYIWPNGDYYVGDFIDGKRNGFGKKYDRVLRKYAEGKFVDGKPENGFKEMYDYAKKNLSTDLSNFFKSQEKGLGFLKNAFSQILEKMPIINSENSNDLLKNISVDFKWKIFIYNKDNNEYFNSSHDWNTELKQAGVKISLESIFSNTAPGMINEVSQEELNHSIIQDISSQFNSCKQFFTDSLQSILDKKNDLPHIEMQEGDSVYTQLYNKRGYHPIVVNHIFVDPVSESIRDDIRVLFMGLGLIEQSVKKRSVHDKETYWKLTEKGNKMMVDIKMKKML